MAIILIKRVNPGMTLKEDVYSKLGGLLYKKGTVLKDRDQEILFAFGVKSISVIEKETKSDQKTQNNNGTHNKQETQKSMDENYTQKYNRLFQLISSILKSAQGNPQIPIIELRNTFEPLVEHINQNPKILLHLNLYQNDQLTKYEIVHSIAVGLLSYSIASWLELEQGERMQVTLAGLLHDVGLSRIPSRILDKTKDLDHLEREEIQKHTIYGYQMLKGTKGLNEGANLAVLQHHERNDGSGYPLRLKQEQIHIYSKIIAIADMFHAMVSRRSYRNELPFFFVLEQLVNESFGRLEPRIVQTFVKMISQITIGSKVILNDNREGVILFINNQNPTRPWVKVANEIINLEVNAQYVINRILY